MITNADMRSEGKTANFFVLNKLAEMISESENENLTECFQKNSVCNLDLNSEIRSAFMKILNKLQSVLIDTGPPKYKDYFELFNREKFTSILKNNEVLTVDRNGSLLHNSILKYYFNK